MLLAAGKLIGAGLATIGVAVVIFALAFFLFPWGSKARSPEKSSRWMFLLFGRGA